MRDKIYIGPAPFEEDCAQVGEPDYGRRSARECLVFIGQIRRHYGNEPEGASLRISIEPHDFGNYREVVVVFDDENREALRYAFDVEADVKGVLGEWDEESRRELGLSGKA